MNPDNHPFGETDFKNYDPEQVNTVEDAIQVFEWLAEENQEAGNGEASGAFSDCAGLLRNEVVEE